MGAMDHGEVREILEDAAIEPGGLERLMAGDTPTAALVASHLAACPDCTDELDRLRRATDVIGPVVRTTPAPELRERTLAYVAALGRPRATPVGAGLAGDTPAGDSSAPVVALPAAMPGRPMNPAGITPLQARAFAPAFAVAAALILAVVGTAFVTSASRDAELQARASEAAAQAAKIEDLDEVAIWTLRVDGEPDVRRIELAGSAGASSASGTLVYSPGTTEVVIVAEGLPTPPTGHEYRCWAESGGARTPIGKMFFAGSLAYWVGTSAPVAGLAPDAAFGVTLIDLASPATPGQDVLLSRS